VGRAWLLVVVGVAGLISMRVAYNVTHEPAPGVRVRWRDGTPDWQRQVLEMKYRLGQPSRPEGLSYSYVLFDTSRRNIMALVNDPRVSDTNDIDRRSFDVPWATAQRSRLMMWAADRIPGLRQPIARWALAAAFAAAILAGGRRMYLSWDWRKRTRALLTSIRPPMSI
jgi:hypothetical protein